MSRRRGVKQDSLELLLDTICNTFGGVLFIAILVVLLLQQTGKAPASVDSAAMHLSVTELQTLTDRLATVDAELSRLKQNRESQDALVENFAPAEVRQLLEQRKDSTARQDALQAEVDRLLTSNATLVAEVEAIQTDNSSVRSGLKDAKTRLTEARAKLAQERQARVQEVRLPVVRETLVRKEIGLILRYGRLYVWHKYEDGVRRGLNTDDFAVVESKPGYLITHPIPTAGVPLDSSKESREAIRRVLSQFDPQYCYLVMIVRPDSFEAFPQVRDVAHDLKFNYRLVPVDTDDPMLDRGGKGGQVQ